MRAWACAACVCLRVCTRACVCQVPAAPLPQVLQGGPGREAPVRLQRDRGTAGKVAGSTESLSVRRGPGGPGRERPRPGGLSWVSGEGPECWT